MPAHRAVVVLLLIVSVGVLAYSDRKVETPRAPALATALS
jgi:hypothetical protein